jgi:signal transduction histidine kinase
VGDLWELWLRTHARLAQTVLDLAMITTVVITFTRPLLPAEVMFHVVFVFLTVHAFLFGLSGTLLRIGIASVMLVVYANARTFGWDEPEFDLSEWPLMFVIAVLVAWMADRRAATARHYASLFRQASERLLTVEEDERRRIALELHDGVGQTLTALTLSLDAARGAAGGSAGSEAVRRVRAARRLAEAGLAEVRQLAHWMRPARIEERGLVASIRDLARLSGFPVRVHVDAGAVALPALEPTATVGAYRIVQEALSNAARHSGAASAEVWIGFHLGRLSIVVADAGNGFDLHQAAESGIGLPGMYERAELLGGGVSIVTAPSRGTQVRLEFPV